MFSFIKKSLYPVNELTIPRPTESNPVIGKCPKCGIELRGAMWYACGQIECPSGLGSKGTL